MTGSPWWFLTRGSGVVALLMLSASVVLGIVNQVRWRNETWPRFALQDLHKNISLYAVAVVGLHVVTSVVDSYAPVGWKDAVIPFISSYRPVWLGLGTLAADLFLAVLITSLVRHRLGYRTWRLVHWLSYASWPAAVLHSVGTGSDAKRGWLLVLTAACVIAVVGAVWWRIAAGWPQHLGRRVVALAASIVTPLALTAFVMAGPLRAGWAKTAGTPARLLAAGRTASTTTSRTNATVSVPFSTTFTGTLGERTESDGSAIITIAGTLAQSGDLFDVQLHGVPLEEGGVSMVDGSATFGTRAEPSLYRGTITSLRGRSIVLSLTSSTGSAISLSIVIQDEGSGTVSGSVSGASA